MSFLEQYTKVVRDAREYVLNAEFEELDIFHLFLYQEFVHGKTYRLRKIRKTGRFIKIITDGGLETYLEWIPSYDSCVIADEIKKQLENETTTETI